MPRKKLAPVTELELFTPTAEYVLRTDVRALSLVENLARTKVIEFEQEIGKIVYGYFSKLAIAEAIVAAGFTVDVCKSDSYIAVGTVVVMQTGLYVKPTKGGIANWLRKEPMRPLSFYVRENVQMLREVGGNGSL